MSECDKNDLVVRTLNGEVRGKLLTTVFGKEFKVFHKIPYAKPPVGVLRFKDPQQVENWNEVLDCTIESSACVHFNLFTKSVVGDEDALYLNAYTKNTKPNKLAPVMVWIHGGGFIMDSSSRDLYSPDFLLEKDIVFFSFNYRLGVFGFLSLDDPDLGVPGNAGLKDQTMALKWIKANACVFGGDPNNVTIFGESAGGASVHYHLISDLSKNLFHKAISMSGVAINEWAMQPTLRNFSFALAQRLGWYENDGTKKALEILQNTDTSHLIGTTFSLISLNEQIYGLQLIFVPSVEPYIAEQSFLTKLPIEAMQNAWSNNIPFMIGAVSDEGLGLTEFHKDLFETEAAYDYFDDFQCFVDIHLNLEKDSEEKKKFGAALKEIYYKNEKPSTINKSYYENMLGDRYFIRGIHEVVRARVNNCNSSTPTYYYRFDFDDQFAINFKLAYGLTYIGVSHGTDLSYVFKLASYEQLGGLQPGSPAFKTVQKMVGMLTSFAATGNPNCFEIKPAHWEPVTTKSPPFKVFNISNELTMIDLPETDRLVALDNVYKTIIN